MPTFYTPINRARALLTADHAVGDGVLVVDDGAIFGGPVPAHPVKLTASVAGVDSHFSIIGRSGNTLTIGGMLEGSSDVHVAAGAAVEVRVTAKDVGDIQFAIANMEQDLTVSHSLTVGGGPDADPILVLSPTVGLASYIEIAASGPLRFFAAGGLDLQGFAPDSVPLRVSPYYDYQSAHLTEWRDASDNLLAAVTAAGVFSGSGEALNSIPQSGVVNLIADLATKSPTASPSFTGTVTIGSLSGLLKATTGAVTVATAGSDYLTPTGNGSGLTGLTESQIAGLTGDLGTLTSGVAARLVAANNLADVASAPSARGNLGLGTAATFASSSFAQSISLTTGGVLYGTTVTFTNTAGAFSGTLSLITQSANAVFAGPTTGSAASPTFRSLVATDIPSLPESQIVGLTADLAAKAPTASPTFTGTVIVGSLSGLLKATSGTVTTATAGTDYLTPTGNGSGLTGLTESQVSGLTSDLAAKAPTASPTFTGTVVIGSLSGLLKATTGTVAVATAGTDYLAPTGNGSGLTSLNASALATGTVTTARLGTGTADATTYLRGDGTWSGLGLGTMATQAASAVAITGGTLTSVTVASHGGSYVASNSGAFDCSASDWFTRTLDGTNGTLSVANVQSKQQFVVELVQDGTGGRTITYSGMTIVWMTSGNTPPPIASAAGLITTLTFKQISTGNYRGWITGSHASSLAASDIPAIPESGVTGLTSDLAAKAPLASPTLSGTITLASITGVLKGTSGVVSAATEGTDYLSGGSNKLPMPFSFSGTGTPTIANDVCPWLHVPFAATANRLTLTANTSPTGNFTVVIKRSLDSGSTFPDTIATVTVSSGTKLATTTTMTNAALAAGDLLRLDITAVNAAANWTARLGTLSRNQ